MLTLTRRARRLPALLLILVLVAACGAEGEGGETTDPASPTTAAETPRTDGIATIDTDLGTILTGPGGLTAYIFTADTEGESTCYDECAALWPPIPADAPIGSGLDAAMFGSTTRTDGSEQLTVNGLPLYLYTPDTRPGDVTGQGFGGVWFVVGTDGEMIGGPEAAAATGTTAPADDDGYGYDY
jgi:predicted lipoprotein with Yx(FWY)xxD motif